MRMMQFKPWLLTVAGRGAGVALGVLAIAVADPLADETPGRSPGRTVIVVEIDVMRIILPRGVRREMHQVMV